MKPPVVPDLLRLHKACERSLKEYARICRAEGKLLSEIVELPAAEPALNQIAARNELWKFLLADPGKSDRPRDESSSLGEDPGSGIPA